MGWWGYILALLTWQSLVSGVIGGAVGTLAMFGLNWFKDRSLAKHKEELGQETVRLTNQLNSASSHEIERLKNELGQSTEAFKLTLKKREWLFDKELEATKAFVELRAQEIGDFFSPEWSIEDTARHMAGRKLQPVENAIRAFRVSHGSVLPPDIRGSLDACMTCLALAIGNYNVNVQPDGVSEKAALAVLGQIVTIEEKLLRLVRE